MSKKRSLVKSIASGILAVGLIGGACATAYHFKDNIKDWIHPDDPIEDDTPNEDLTNTPVYVDDVAIDGDNASVNYVPQSIAFTKANNRASNGNTLSFTANVLPSYATNQSITWSLEWNGTNSNKVTDYVSLASTNNGKNVSLTCIKGFNTQIKLTGKTVDGATATTTIDLLKYIDSVNFYSCSITDFETNKTKLITQSLTYQQDFIYETDKLLDFSYLDWDTGYMDSLNNCGLSFDYNVVGTVGTITKSYYYETYDDFYKYCYNQGLATLDDAYCDVVNSKSSYRWTCNDSLGNLAGNDGFINVCGSANGITDYEFKTILANYGTSAIEYYGEFTTTYGSYSNTQHIGCTFGFEVGYIKSTGITINGNGVFA